MASRTRLRRFVASQSAGPPMKEKDTGAILCPGLTAQEVLFHNSLYLLTQTLHSDYSKENQAGASQPSAADPGHANPQSGSNSASAVEAESPDVPAFPEDMSSSLSADLLSALIKDFRAAPCNIFDGLLQLVHRAFSRTSHSSDAATSEEAVEAWRAFLQQAGRILRGLSGLDVTHSVEMSRYITHSYCEWLMLQGQYEQTRNFCMDVFHSGKESHKADLRLDAYLGIASFHLFCIRNGHSPALYSAAPLAAHPMYHIPYATPTLKSLPEQSGGHHHKRRRQSEDFVASVAKKPRRHSSVDDADGNVGGADGLDDDGSRAPSPGRTGGSAQGENARLLNDAEEYLRKAVSAISFAQLPPPEELSADVLAHTKVYNKQHRRRTPTAIFRAQLYHGMEEADHGTSTHSATTTIALSIVVWELGQMKTALALCRKFWKRYLCFLLGGEADTDEADHGTWAQLTVFDPFSTLPTPGGSISPSLMLILDHADRLYQCFDAARPGFLALHSHGSAKRDTDMPATLDVDAIATAVHAWVTEGDSVQLGFPVLCSDGAEFEAPTPDAVPTSLSLAEWAFIRTALLLASYR